LKIIKKDNKQHSCTAVVTGKAVNPGDGEGMQLPCTLNFEGRRNILFLRSTADYMPLFLFTRKNCQSCLSTDIQTYDFHKSQVNLA